MRSRFTTASCCATSSCWPTPVVWRWMIAARTPIAQCSPAPVSARPPMAFVGGPSGQPVMLSAPAIAWAIHSKLLYSAYGPPPPAPEPLHRARPHVLDDDVGALRQLLEDRAAARRLEVERHALLAGVQQEEEPRVLAALVREHRAAGLAARRLDLDDVGPEPRGHLGTARPRLVLGQV